MVGLILPTRAVLSQIVRITSRRLQLPTFVSPKLLENKEKSGAFAPDFFIICVVMQLIYESLRLRKQGVGMVQLRQLALKDGFIIAKLFDKLMGNQYNEVYNRNEIQITKVRK